jgi:ADP-heptose:LPS heptosyltransferase
MLHYIKSVRATKYDIALNIAGSSTSAQIVSLLVKAKYKASFESDKIWVNFSHLQKNKFIYKHMGLRSLEFLSFFNIPLPEKTPSLDIKLNQQELQTGKEDLEKLLKENNISHNKKVVAIFRNARFDKKISDEWWDKLIKTVLKNNKEILFIDILSPDIPEKLNDQVLSYSNKNLRLLSAFFHACDLYISADTGPLHLAVASNTKVLALFNKTDIELYGALGENNKTINIDKLSIEEVSQIISQSLDS